MAKTLIYDIETSPNFGAYFQLYKENNIVWTSKHWYMLSFAWKWLGEKKIYCKALPDYSLYKKDPENDLLLVKDLWQLFNEADIIIAHNGVAFDTKKTNARFIHHKLKPPEPYHEIDTKLIAKKHFKFDSNKLDDLGDYLGVGRKLQTGGFILWKECLEGKEKAWNTMKRYNKGDVDLLEKIYLCMRPYIKNHPNTALMDGELSACPNCGSKNIIRKGFAFNRATVMQRYKCTDCGAWSRRPQTKFNKETQIR